MNMLQKTLLSAAAILTFSSYSYYLRTQDTQLALAVSTADAANTAQQNSADGTAAPVSSDFQAYVDQINAEAKQQAAQPKPSVVTSGGEGGGEDGQGDEEGRSRQVVAQKVPVTTVQQKTNVQSQVSIQAAQQKAAALALSQQQAAAQALADQQAAALAQQQAAQSAGQYKNGSYTGSSVNVYYGYVQVKAIIQGGKIADVQFLQYPSDRNTSRYINSQAMPLLTQEAIQAQSAQVNGVSGASATSQGFVQSLGNALAQAQV